MAKIMRRRHLCAAFSATDFPEVVNFQFLLHLHFSFCDRKLANSDSANEQQKKMIQD